MMSKVFDASADVVQQFLSTKASRVILHGPMGCGKTRAALEYVRACCLKYPGSRWALVRSYRRRMTNSLLVEWENEVLKKSDILNLEVPRLSRSVYHFANGSDVVVVGMDGFDAVVFQEWAGAVVFKASELTEHDIAKVGNRIRQDNVPHQPFILTTTPQSTKHFLHEYVIDRSSHWTAFAMRRQDNRLFYRSDGTPTDVGRVHEKRLDNLTGVQRLRLRDGQWTDDEPAEVVNFTSEGDRVTANEYADAVRKYQDAKGKAELAEKELGDIVTVRFPKGMPCRTIGGKMCHVSYNKDGYVRVTFVDDGSNMNYDHRQLTTLPELCCPTCGKALDSTYVVPAKPTSEAT